MQMASSDDGKRRSTLPPQGGVDYEFSISSSSFDVWSMSTAVLTATGSDERGRTSGRMNGQTDRRTDGRNESTKVNFDVERLLAAYLHFVRDDAASRLCVHQYFGFLSRVRVS